MHDSKSFEARWARLLVAAKATRSAALASALGIRPQSVNSVRKRRKIPDAWIGRISERFGVSADWLLYGKEPASGEQTPQTHSGQKEAAGHADVPLIGLASCGLAGWYNPGPLAVRVSLEYASEGLFAVLAVGTSMQPEGIRQGYVLFCDPLCAPEEGDAVFIRKTDGTVAVKRFLGQDASWVRLQGWLDPDAGGAQRPYQEKLAREAVASMACVVIVRRKA